MANENSRPAGDRAATRSTTKKTGSSLSRPTDNQRRHSRELRTKLTAIASLYGDDEPGVAELATYLADELDDRKPCWSCTALDYEARERLTDCSSVCPQQAVNHRG